MQTTSLIGRRCKHSNVFSWPILIDRGLEPPESFIEWLPISAMGWSIQDVHMESLSFGFWYSSVYLFRLVEKTQRHRDTVFAVFFCFRQYICEKFDKIIQKNIYFLTNFCNCDKIIMSHKLNRRATNPQNFWGYCICSILSGRISKNATPTKNAIDILFSLIFVWQQ